MKNNEVIGTGLFNNLFDYIEDNLWWFHSFAPSVTRTAMSCK